VLAAAVPLTMKAHAYPFGHRIGAGHQVTLTEARRSARRIQPMMAPSSSSAWVTTAA
jgi:hypothetical protein